MTRGCNGRICRELIYAYTIVEPLPNRWPGCDTKWTTDEAPTWDLTRHTYMDKFDVIYPNLKSTSTRRWT